MYRARLRTTIAGILATAVLTLSCTGADAVAPDAGRSTPSPTDRLTLHLEPRTDSLFVGEIRQLAARISNQLGEPRTAPITWKSLSPTSAIVSAAGQVTAVASGNARIVASIDGAADTASITILTPPSALSLFPQTVRVALGDSLRFSASLSSGAVAQSAVSWSISNTSVATITSDGTLVSTGEGDAVVTATTGSDTSTAAVSVFKTDVASVTVSPANITISAGASVNFDAVLRDSDGRILPSRGIRWTSSNPTVASMSSNGRATGISRGYTIISAEAEGKTGTATLNVGSKPVASVVVTLPSAQLAEGATITATARVLDADGNPITDQPIAWQSGNTSIATVVPSGDVLGIAAGNTTISAISGGKVGSAPLSVVKRNPATIVVVPSSPSVTVGAQVPLTAEVRDQSGSPISGVQVTWSSDNQEIASITSTGTNTATLKGLSAGSAGITVRANGMSGSATATVSAVAVASVAVSPSSATLTAGTEMDLAATTRDANGNVLTERVITWSSSNPSVVFVTPDGAIKGVAAGTATITATSEGKSASAAIAVTGNATAPVASVSVTLNSTTLNVGQSTQATAVLRDASGKVLTGRPITWSSANPSVATVSPSGLVTALGAGSVAIVATSEEQSGASTLSVSAPAPAPVASVTVTLSSNTLTVGQTTQAQVTLKDAAGNILTGRTVGWSSSNSSVASVSASGLVTSLATGASDIVASSGSVSGKASLTVSPPSGTGVVASVTVTGTSTLTVGQNVQLTATARDASGAVVGNQTYTWSTSEYDVASVSPSGMVTTKYPGSSRITAQAANGVSGYLDVTVTQSTSAPVATVSVALVSSNLVVGLTTQASVVLKDASGQILTGRVVTYSSSNTQVATVNSSGLVTAMAAGTANIVATSEGKTGSASLLVASSTTNPLPPPPPPGGLQAVPPALPTLLNTQYVTPTGRTLNVAAGGNLQTAIDTAQRGDVILLQPGVTYTGNFTLKPKSGSGWITIRSAASDAQLPAEGQRITPAYASAMPKLVTSGSNTSVFVTAAGASGYRLMGLQITAASSTTYLYALVQFGGGGSQGQTTLASVPTDLILDRVWVHGHSTLNLQRCVTLNSARSAVIDSYLGDCHGQGYDSQAILGWNGPGPFKIVNNYLEGAGENIMFGGADPAIANLIPSDIEIRRNHFFKPLNWKGVWTVKNLFELKNARRVLVEGNIFENNWADAQVGFALPWKSVNQDGGCGWCQTSDVTFRWNIVRQSPSALGIAANPEVYPAVPAARFLIEHNLFENIGQANGTCNGRHVQVSGALKDVAIVNNTMIHNAMTCPGQWILAAGGPAGAQNLVIRNNIATWGGPYGAVMSDGWAIQGSATLSAYASSYAFEGNTVIELPSNLITLYPTGNYWPSSIGSVGFVSSTDYTLSASSPYRGKAVGGGDPGADISTLKTKISGVVVP